MGENAGTHLDDRPLDPVKQGFSDVDAFLGWLHR